MEALAKELELKGRGGRKLDPVPLVGKTPDTQDSGYPRNGGAITGALAERGKRGLESGGEIRVQLSFITIKVVEGGGDPAKQQDRRVAAVPAACQTRRFHLRGHAENPGNLMWRKPTSIRNVNLAKPATCSISTTIRHAPLQQFALCKASTGPFSPSKCIKTPSAHHLHHFAPHPTAIHHHHLHTSSFLLQLA